LVELAYIQGFIVNSHSRNFGIALQSLSGSIALKRKNSVTITCSGVQNWWSCSKSWDL